MTSDSPTADLHTVRLLGFPLDLYARAQEHGDGLMREFTYIAVSQHPDRDMPARLLSIVRELSVRYATVATEPERQRDDALDRGDTTIDLTYEVPASVAAASRHLGELLDEADEFCRRGTLLLSMATPPDSVAFRRWYLDEFIRQIAGEPPIPWSNAMLDALVPGARREHE